MTTNSSTNKDKSATLDKGSLKSKTQHNRNKKTNSKGEPYDKRKGSYTECGSAYRELSVTLNSWLTRERCDLELEILNENKIGRRYQYPPSLIQYLLLLKENSNFSYRRIIDDHVVQMDKLNLPIPTFSTLHQSEAKFFASTYGWDIIDRATDIMKNRGIDEFDPRMLISTGVCPEYSAPQKIPTCQKDVEEQQEKDRKAENYRKQMEVIVLNSPVEDGTNHLAALDGSGEGTSGAGIYIEKIWNQCNRNFIKQHVMIDVDTQEPLAFAITFEKPGDSSMMIPFLEGCQKSGLKISGLLADSAYDSIANWKSAGEKNIRFVPNLKSGFGLKNDLPERNSQLLKEKELGKTEFHVETEYNKRWLVEAFFSFEKKLFGERVRSKRFYRMVMTMSRRIVLCSLYKRAYAKARGYKSGNRQMASKGVAA